MLTLKAVPYGRRASGVPHNASGRSCVLCNCAAFCAVQTTDITACETLLLAHLTDTKLSPRCVFSYFPVCFLADGGKMLLEYATTYSFPTLIQFIPSLNAT